MNDLIGTPTPEDRLRTALRTLAADAAVEPSWDELVADLDRVVVIERPSPRRTLLLATGIAAALVVLIGVIAAVRVGRDDTPAADPTLRHWSFVGGDTSGLTADGLPAEVLGRRFVSDDGDVVLATSSTPVGTDAAVTIDSPVPVTVRGTAVELDATSDLRQATWTSGDTQRAAIVVRSDRSHAPLAAEVRTALTGLELPQAGCPASDPLCRPPAGLAGLAGNDSLPDLLRVLPALVGAADTPTPPVGFRTVPLLDVADGGRVGSPTAMLLYWRTATIDPDVATLGRAVDRLLLAPKAEAPVAATVGGRPAVVYVAGQSDIDAPSQASVLWSPAPGWVALVVGYGKATGVASSEATLAAARTVGEVDPATWDALPKAPAAGASSARSPVGGGQASSGALWTVWKSIGPDGVAPCLSVTLATQGPVTDCLVATSGAASVRFVTATLVAVLAPADEATLTVRRTDGSGAEAAADAGLPMPVRGVDYWVYVFEVPTGTRRVDVQRVGTDGAPVGPPLTATTAA